MIVPGTILVLALSAAGADPAFSRQRLSTEFYCEGANFADFDRDGHGDVVSGPFLYYGPDFVQKAEIYSPKPFDPLAYSDNFFAFPRDFDGDGWIDVLVVGFPGEAAVWYENPKGREKPGPWARHVAWPNVDNESPAFADLTGDGRPELVCHSGGTLGYATPDPSAPRKPWTFHPISEPLGLQRFTHGLGVGDLNGDGRADFLLKDAWWEQPPPLEGGKDRLWKRHPVPFSDRIGGAQMGVFDVDGDGDADVVTSLHAHGYGLAWCEQVKKDEAGGEIEFVRHVVMDDAPEKSRHGLVFSELHALAFADVDADGLLDVVTGKRWWAHGPDGGPDGRKPGVLYWFETVRGPDGVDFVPHLVDDASGVGTQVVAGDLDGDGKTDFVVGNKQGTFVFLQEKEPPGGAKSTGMLPLGDDGRPLNLDFETGTLKDWTATGDAFEGQPVKGDTVARRIPGVASGHQGEYWIGGYELKQDGPKGTLTSRPFRVTERFASFLVDGGSADTTRVEIVRRSDGAVIYKTSGADYETLQRVVVDLDAERGREIFVRLVDEQPGGWGHVNFDDFRLYAEKPDFEADEGLPPLLPLDPVPHAGLSPLDAVKAMTVPEGFRVDVVAAEPDLHQPIAFAFDSKGRIFVAEAYAYPRRRKDGEGKDTVLVFEDSDRDGSFEKRTVFAEGLNLVSGLEVGFGGVWVGAAPHLLFIPDRDGDLVPDGPPETLLDGWAFEDTHETLNAFNWGPDGWLYGCHGVFTHSKVGKPGAKDEDRVPLNAAVWRYHPARHEFEIFAEGTSNPWGIDFDDDGEAFITACVIPHLYHVVPGARYERQSGSHFEKYTYDDVKTIADHRHYLGTWPHGGNLRSNAAGGGHAHCGALVYLGDAFPERYRNTIFMANMHGNRVNNDRLVPKGSGFVGEHGPDFLLSNDKWFRGVSLKTGPDGAVYLIDWYDQQACHDTTIERWDRTNGRLYRVSYGEPRSVAADLGAMSDSDLVALHLRENDWWVRRARLTLQERGAGESAGASDALKKILADAPDPRRKLRALWTLHATGALEEALALELLSSPFDRLRAWTVRLLVEGKSPSPAALARFEALARSSRSAVERLALASALQRMPLESRWGLAEALAAHGEDDADHNIPLVLWYGVEPLVPEDPSRALALARSSRIGVVSRFLVRRAAEEKACHADLVAFILAERDRDRRETWVSAMAEALKDARGLEAPEGWSALYAEVSRDADAPVREDALRIAVAFGDRAAFPDLRRLLVSDAAPEASRKMALDALVAGADREALPAILSLLKGGLLRGPALRALGAFDDARVPVAILERYGTLTDAERRDALNTLSSRPANARALVEAIAQGSVPREHLGAFALRNLRNLGDAEIDGRLASVFGLYRDTPEEKRKRIDELKKKLGDEALAKADLPRGRDVFDRTCAQCHVFFGTGGSVGPEITGANRSDVEYLVTNMIDPNQVIGKDYQVTVVRTKDERVVTGILKRANESSLVLETENDTIVVPRRDVADAALSDVSMMPEGQLDPMSEDEVRDLVAYLRAPAQVPMRATPGNAAKFFDGKSLAYWRGSADVFSVEDGEIVGRTAKGLVRNEFLKSDLDVGDFRLSLDVKLSGDEGNSGIQFRSREIEGGDVAGYQADVGPGWWGKLYEEHGRAVLWNESGEAHVKKGEWNRYEILAVGHRVRTWINGRPCVDLDDPDGARRGIVALQVHSGGPTEVRFRNLRLEPMDPPAAPRESPAPPQKADE